ncbi:protein RICE SALT SENSITIVE 3-like isoform X2 [Punica granatum]|uniref:Protein RICE SALT SENSITIVE 3-like isoform X2 n=1 Tax=Punica granatum TaxID=22663 RepID=A0A6P8E1J1_PUNGR|nr:protein RICE SALT SENSITIVE 3-like isoform X2 [Punica granatum]
MEGGLPTLNCLLQHTLRSLCSSDFSPNSSKWVYSVFWRILPRNYPPPNANCRWEFGGGAIDRAKGNERNWILVWEDGYCDFYECEGAGNGYMKGRFGPEVFFKMSHEVYSYGEGLVGKVAADNSHKWVFRDSQNELESNFISSWNMSIEPQPKAWEAQFNAGIQTIAIIAVREGIVQLGSLDKVVEDINLVIKIQRKFSYLQSIPGVFSIQRPFLPPHLTGIKRSFDEGPAEPGNSPSKSLNLGWNGPQNDIPWPQPSWPIPSLLPGLGAWLSKVPSGIPTYNPNGGNSLCGEVRFGDVKVEPSCHLDGIREEKPRPNKENSLNLAD